MVSIHAPARGATWVQLASTMQGTCFNPRPREGGDLNEVASTHLARSFNPRPREGGDIDKQKAEQRKRVSIHAPARGATAYSESS